MDAYLNKRREREERAKIFQDSKISGKDEVNATDTVALTHVVKATDTINPD